MVISSERIEAFERELINKEKAPATVEKYLRDLRAFVSFVGEREVGKELVLAYKAYLQQRYTIASANSMLSSLGTFFAFCERRDLGVKRIRQHRRVFSAKERELTRVEYERLLQAALDKGNRRLYLLMQTVCGCGIRVSELQFITAEAVARGYADISCKGNCRRVFLPKELCKLLSGYLRQKKIKSGAVFVTRSGKPLDRSNIWSDMKKLCQAAQVAESKVFPHNLRHLFARTFYTIQKDIVRLSSILGHSNINTTMIYTMESGRIHQKQIQQLGVLC